MIDATIDLTYSSGLIQLIKLAPVLIMKKIYFLFGILSAVGLQCYGQGDSIQILPANPSGDDTIRVVTYKCSFDKTTYEINSDTIFLTVTTNGLREAPCILDYDTVRIGTLEPGEWTLFYQYVDEAIPTSDSVLYTETLKFVVTVVTGTSYIPTDTGWWFYPNPAGNLITIENLRPDLKLSKADLLSIIDFNGRVLFQEPLRQKRSTVNIAGLKTGEYILRIMDGNTSVNLRMQKK